MTFVEFCSHYSEKEEEKFFKNLRSLSVDEYVKTVEFFTNPENINACIALDHECYRIHSIIVDIEYTEDRKTEHKSVTLRVADTDEWFMIDGDDISLNF